MTHLGDFVDLDVLLQVVGEVAVPAGALIMFDYQQRDSTCNVQHGSSLWKVAGGHTQEGLTGQFCAQLCLCER